MLPWQIIARWSFYGFLTFMAIMEITEDRDGMHQEFDQWSDKEFEKRRQKADRKWNKEEHEFVEGLLDAPTMLKKARKRRLQEERKNQKAQQSAGQGQEDEEEVILSKIKELYKELQQQVAAEEAENATAAVAGA